MRKEWLKAVPPLVGLLAVLAIVGCPGKEPEPTSNTPSTAAKNAPEAAKKSAPPPKPMLDGWAKPAMAIVLSGEQHGYIEPCGCSATQSGGLSRRANFFKQLDDKGWKHAVFDLGGLARKDNLQNRLKFQAMLKALQDMGYSALGLGSEELSFERVEPAFLLTQNLQPADANAVVPSFVNANVEFTLFKGSNTQPAAPVKIVTVDGRKIGVTSIFGKGLRRLLFGEQTDAQLAVLDPEKVLPDAIKQLKEQKAEVLVLLSHASDEESAALAKQFPDFHLVLTAGGPEDGRDAAKKVDKTLVISVGQKGKHVGVVGYYPDNKAEPFRFELVDLDKARFQDTPQMAERMREYQQMLADNYDRVMSDLPKAPHPSGDKFAGAESCKDCHKKAWAVWSKTKHAKAYESLITGREGQKNVVPRNRDPECLCCHTTGWDPQQVFPFESGFYSLEQTPKMKGQQCENCHGPATKHVTLETQWKKDRKSVKEDDLNASRKAVRLTKAAAEKSLCIKCHDYENDPEFNFAKRWEQVQHPGRD